MPFTVIPVINRMIELYHLPVSPQRFEAYLKLLQGTSKTDIELPIGFYNPMAKPHVREQLIQLLEMDAENTMTEALESISFNDSYEIKTALNLADDLMGGWTNRYTTDYDSRFKNHALVKRNMCSVILWTGEQHSPELIKERTLAAAARTLYRMEHPQPETLQQHIEQELYVSTIADCSPLPPQHSALYTAFIEEHKHSNDYGLIFNFLYGDAASEALGMPLYGMVHPFGGFGFAAQYSKKH